MATETAPDRAERAHQVLQSLRRRDRATLAQLAHDAQISRPTANLIVSELEAEGLLTHSLSNSGAGRPAARYCFAPRHGFVVALDIQRDEVTLTAASVAGKVLHCSIKPLREPTRDDRLDELVGHVQRLVEALSPDHGAPVCGFASTTGIVDGDGRILRTFSVPQWHDMPLTDELRARLGFGWGADNDINCAAYGEFTMRVSQARLRWTDTMLHIRVFAGFRTGLILGGEIHHGHHWHAGEINDILDGDLRSRSGTDRGAHDWTIRAATTIATVSSLIDPAVAVISTLGLREETPTTEIWDHLQAMRLPTAPPVNLETGDLNEAAASIGALSLALRGAETHFLHVRPRYPVAVGGLDQVIRVAHDYAMRREAQAHRQAVVVSEPLQVGVIGSGPRACIALHVESDENKAQIVGAYDPGPAVSERLVQALGDAVTHCPVRRSVRELIEHGIGAALVVIPDGAREAAELLEAGIPVFLDRPVADLAVSTTVLMDAKDNRARLHVGTERAAVSEIRRLIRDGAIGDVTSVWARRFLAEPLDGSQAVLDIDATLWLANSTATNVVGMGGQLDAHVMMTLASGATASYQQARGPESTFGFTVTGSLGRIELGDEHTVGVWTSDGHETISINVNRDAADQQAVTEFLRFVRTGVLPSSSPAEAWHATAVVDQALSSIRKGATLRPVPTLSSELASYFAPSDES